LHKRVLMLSAATFALFSGQALADTTISNKTTSPVTTSADGNITIETDGSIVITTNPVTSPAVMINSSDMVSNAGMISYTGVSSATGVELVTGNTGEIESTGTIDLTGTGTGKIGIEISGPSGDANSGTFTGIVPTGGGDAVAIDLATGSTTKVQGDSSFGIESLSGTNIAGDIDIGGTLTITPENANSTSTQAGNVIAMDIGGTMTGNINILAGGTVVAYGQGAEGIQLLGALTGSIVNAGNLETFGSSTATTTNTNANSKLPEAGTALGIGASVSGGVYNAGPSTAADTTTARAEISTVGTAPTILINPTLDGVTPTTSLVIGYYSDTTDPNFAFLNRGTISGQSTNADQSVTTFEIDGASSAVQTMLTGGLFNGGSITATGVTNSKVASVTATTLSIGNYAVVPLLKNSNESDSGSITASVSGPESGTATAISIQQYGTLNTIDNSGTISASVTTTNPLDVTALTAYAIYDSSGTLNTINNSGTISAVATTLNNNAQVAEAANLSVNSTGVNFTNTGTVTGAILFGTGNDTLSDTGTAQQPATINGNISFGGTNNGGVDTLTIGSFGTVSGAVTETLGGHVNVTIAQGGTLNLENSPSSLEFASGGVVGLYAGTFDVESGGTLGLTVSQPFNLTAFPNTTALIEASTSASIGDDTPFKVSFGSFITSTESKPAVFDLISAPKGDLDISSAELKTIETDFTTPVSQGGSLPYLFTGGVCTWNVNDASSCKGTNPDLSELVLELTPKSIGTGANQIPLTGFAAKMFPYANEALVNDYQLGAAVLNGVTDAQQAQAAYAAFAPDVSGAARALAISLTDEATNVVAARQRALREYADDEGDTTLWGQEFVQRLNQDNTSAGTGYRDTGFGLSLGMDQGDAEDGRYGGAFTFFSGDMNAKAPVLSKTNSEWYMATGYTDWHGKAFFLDTQATVGYAHLNGSRTIDVDSLVRTATNQHPAEYMAGGATAGVQYDWGGTVLMPQLSLDGMAMREEGYKEAKGGDGFDLNVDPSYAASLRAFTGVDARQDINLGSFLLQPEGRVGYRYDIANGVQSLKVNFESVTPTDQFEISGPQPAHGNALAGGGISVSTGAWSVQLGFDYLYANTGNTSEEGTITLLGRI